jgi:hypothetical protein
MNALVLYTRKGDRSRTSYHGLRKMTTSDCLEQVKAHTTTLHEFGLQTPSPYSSFSLKELPSTSRTMFGREGCQKVLVSN